MFLDKMLSLPIVTRTKSLRYIGLVCVLIGVCLRADLHKLFRPATYRNRQLFDSDRWEAVKAHGPMSGLVVGATGAVGTELVKQMCESRTWGEVTVLVRKPLELPQDYKDLINEHVVSHEEFEAALADPRYYEGQEAVFWALGTSRAAAETNENFYKVDHDYAKLAAETAARSGVRHFSLVSAAANRDYYTPMDNSLFHPLMFLKTKHHVEKSVTAADIPSITIYRPGMMAKDWHKLTGIHFFLAVVLNKLPVEEMATAMILKAEESQDGIHSYEDDEIRSLVNVKRVLTIQRRKKLQRQHQEL